MAARTAAVFPAAIRRSTAGVRKASAAAGVEAEVGGTRDLALAHGDAAHDLREILAERRLQEQGFASSEAAPFLEPPRPRRHLPQALRYRLQTTRNRAPRIGGSRECAPGCLALRCDPPRDGGARRREKASRSPRARRRTARRVREGGAALTRNRSCRALRPATFPARRRARNVMARFRFARRTPLASVISAMMMPQRRVEAEKRLQQAMNGAGAEQVVAAGDQSHPGKGVIDGHREMIAGRRILAGDHYVAESRRVHALSPALRSRQASGPAMAAARAESSRQACGSPAPMRARRVSRVQTAAGSRIVEAVGPVRRPRRRARSRRGWRRGCRSTDRSRRGGRAPRARRRSPSICADCRPGLGVPFHAQPCKVLKDRRLEFGAAAGAVDVLDAQREAPVRPRRFGRANSAA